MNNSWVIFMNWSFLRWRLHIQCIIHIFPDRMNNNWFARKAEIHNVHKRRHHLRLNALEKSKLECSPTHMLPTELRPAAAIRDWYHKLAKNPPVFLFVSTMLVDSFSHVHTIHAITITMSGFWCKNHDQLLHTMNIVNVLCEKKTSSQWFYQ